MMRWPLAALLCCGIVLPAQAQENCAAREAVIEYLSDRYREAPVAMGMTNGGEVLEILTSADGASWTILVTSSDGRSCMVAAGDNWRSAPLAISRLEPQG